MTRATLGLIGPKPGGGRLVAAIARSSIARAD
jgi:hypothetical protein